jgi:hypothetical protein
MARITEAFRVEECPGESRAGRQCVRLLEPLEYRVRADDSEELIVAPAGFETDFASIPFGLRNLFPPLGPWARPAILHDFLYGTQGTGRFEGVRWISRARDYSRAEADGIFREAMAVVGVPVWRRGLMYRAVRLGGRRGWGS